MITTTKATADLIDLILKELRGDLFSEEKTKIVQHFSDLCNNFSRNYPEITEAILADPDIFKNFTILASACAIVMGYAWECDEKNSYRPHWDERKKASEKFCHEHFDLFRKIFRDVAGFEFPFRGKREYLFCLRDMAYRGTPLTPRSALWGELADFSTEHSTLKQKSMVLFCRILGKGGIYPELLSDVRFPFI